MYDVQTCVQILDEDTRPSACLRSYMQDVVISEESLSAYESMKARMALTGVQLDPLPFRRGVQRLVKLNFPNGSKIHQFMPDDAGALRLEVRTAAPFLPISSGGVNV